MPQPPIPEELGRAFAARTALGHGLSARRLRAPDLARPFHGARALVHPQDARQISDEHPADTRRRAALQRAAEYAVVMASNQFFSHETAALMWGVPLPNIRDLDPHVSSFGPVRHPRTRGVHGHETSHALCRVVRHPELGVAIADPATTWAMLGSVLRDPYDLVAAGDAVVRIPRMPGGFDADLGEALAPISALSTAVAAGRRRGRPALREALPRLRTGASSRPESWCRLLIIDAGLPEPEIDVDVYTHTGMFIGCVDLAYPELKIAIEYEGDQHRTSPEQWQRDIDKHEQLGLAGWRVIRVSRAHVFGEAPLLVRRLRAVLATRG